VKCKKWWKNENEKCEIWKRNGEINVNKCVKQKGKKPMLKVKTYQKEESWIADVGG
jgi:hypothetical protein